MRWVSYKVMSALRIQQLITWPENQTQRLGFFSCLVSYNNLRFGQILFRKFEPLAKRSLAFYLCSLSGRGTGLALLQRSIQTMGDKTKGTSFPRPSVCHCVCPTRPCFGVISEGCTDSTLWSLLHLQPAAAALTVSPLYTEMGFNSVGLGDSTQL